MSTHTLKKKLSNMKTQELKEELMHYRETETNLWKEVERLTKEVDGLKKITEEQNKVKQNQHSEFEPQLHYRNQIVKIRSRTIWTRLTHKKKMCGACWFSNRAQRRPTQRSCCWCILNSRRRSQ